MVRRSRSLSRIIQRTGARPQPGVADPGIESLVDEKVDAFWKGVDGGASKSGRITVTFSEKRPKKSTWFQVYAGEVHVSGTHPSLDY